MLKEIRTLLDKKKLTNVLNFLGRGIVGIWFAGILVSLISFVVEIAFTFSLQWVLASLGGKQPVPIGPVQINSTLDLKEALGVLILIMLIRTVVQWAGSINGRAISHRFAFNQRSRIIQWVFRSRSVNSSEALSLFSEKLVRGAEGLEVAQSFFSNALVATLLFCILLAVSKKLVLVGLICVLVLAAIHRRAGKKLIVYSRRIQSHSFEALKSLNQSIKNILLIRIHHLQKKHSDAALASLEKIYSNSVRANWTSSTALFFGQISAALAAVVLIFFAKFETHVSVQKAAVFLYLFFRFSQRTSQATASLSDWMMKRPYVFDLYRWYNTDYSLWTSESTRYEDNGKREEGRLAKPLGWHIKDISFSYSGHDPLFKNFDLEIEPGSMNCVSGPSGVGKTTLIYLLLGQLSPTAGRVEVDIDGIRKPLIDVQHHVLENVGYAGPEPYLIPGSIRENLSFGLHQPYSNSHYEKLVEVAECQFIKQLKAGLEHRIGDQGDGLSAGQKQRICLLRALLRNPRALILDEATSHLDFKTELKILDNLKSVAENCTVILISHREQVKAAAKHRIELHEPLSLTEAFVSSPESRL